MMKMITPNYFYKQIGYDEVFVEELIRNIDSYYYEFEELKYDGNGAPKIKQGVHQKRYYNPSVRELKDIQNKIQSNFLSKVELLPNVLGGIKGNSNVKNAKIHKGKEYFFQTDISNFFPTINPEMVFYSLSKKGFTKKVANLITSLVTLKTKDSRKVKSLPQGAPTSQMISNIVFERIDIEIIEILKGTNVYYSRWVDDLTFSSSHDFSSIHQNILSTIAKYGFKVNREKTTYRKGKTEITGVLLSRCKMQETNRFKSKDESRLNEYQIAGRRAYSDFIQKVNNDNSMKSGLFKN